MIPRKKESKKEAGSAAQPEAQSQEFQAFEKLVKKVISVPKSELDRRETEAAATASKKRKSS
jgi:hypothetical protein